MSFTELVATSSRLAVASMNSINLNQHGWQIEEDSPTPAEIFNWVMTQEATAVCFVRDVLEAVPEHGKGKHDLLTRDLIANEKTGPDRNYFWLNKIPCRSVGLVGMLVGVKVMERKIVYTCACCNYHNQNSTNAFG
jgi:hypothetical protein